MMPQNVLSDRPISAPFNPPRTNLRFGAIEGLFDSHFGGIAIGDPSQGIVYQIWSLAADHSGNLFLSAPNTPSFSFLPGVNAVWCALAFDQNARAFAAYCTAAGSAHYYWYDTTIPGYTTTALSGVVTRVFAALDDSRVAESATADILLVYERAGELFFRQQRDRYLVEYDLGPAPATLVQVGMNQAFRFQFAFENTLGAFSLPPVEYLGVH